jgi:hypothetical protein
MSKSNAMSALHPSRSLTSGRNVIEIERLRFQLLSTLRRFKVARLDNFLYCILRNTEAVEAYFEPKALTVNRGNATSRISLLPFEASLRAARKTLHYEILPPHERGLAAVAAFLQPAGIYCVTARAVRGACLPGEVSAHSARQYAKGWLEDGLRSLRSREPALGATLSATLDMGDDGDCDPQQVARLVAARSLANLNIERVWLPGPL